MGRQFENIIVKSNASTRYSPQIAKTIDSSQLKRLSSCKNSFYCTSYLLQKLFHTQKVDIALMSEQPTKARRLFKTAPNSLQVLGWYIWGWFITMVLINQTFGSNIEPQFIHETQCLFQVLEITGTSGSLIMNFFKY
jgi:hypothetical protein